ncbi:efflux RND transporter periplasmic adaptor subunit [Agriterribacter sp.]|uniref:efflux RND transporter periplasmic adaptor subunit n=1 Tax=Agriterribacter sp. TaxID=2821509 RepID=UPI002BF1D563|nr:efflux RND transporter periplasmic adaptor subunit [Agriterribacter sp.]HRO47512.1 efflux RND transporter periplasmic adaptor subunit [Agriterribacter sp.]HRQ18322.1 efflux RND transporter periplasmic adaptor subunit [Agriterribacter sp.]
MNTNYSIASVFIFPLLAGLLSCGGANKKAAGAADAVKDYPVITVEPRATTLSSDYPATIEGQQNIEIRPKIDGYIDKIYVDEGTPVKRGQMLFKIFAPQYEQEVRTAQANIKIAEANVNAAEMEVNKVRPLVDKNIISRYELESAEFSLQSRQAALAQAQASLVNARTNLSYTVVTSPVNGVIGNLPYKIGSLVSSNTALPLTTVSNINNIYAYFSINEKQALEFATTIKGATARERLKAIPPVTLILATGMVFPEKGHIETASGLINTETGSVRVRATFPNPGSMVRSGSSGIVRIPANLDAAILVPQKSTYEIQGKKFVYLLDSAGTVKSVEIRIRQNTGGQYFVVEEGLKPGDKIILEGVATLREGAPVIPREVSADSVFNRGK